MILLLECDCIVPCTFFLQKYAMSTAFIDPQIAHLHSGAINKAERRRPYGKVLVNQDHADGYAHGA